MDTILLLTDDRYLFAEYDSNLDKIVQFQKVPLDNITEVELGLYQHQTKMFQGSIAPYLCLRLNYTVNGADGYFHMLRSPNIRFFNNVALAIKTKEEIAESLMAIVEFFRITLESRGRSNVMFTTNAPLARKRSKIPALDVPKVHITYPLVALVSGIMTAYCIIMYSRTRRACHAIPPNRISYKLAPKR